MTISRQQKPSSLSFFNILFIHFRFLLVQRQTLDTFLVYNKYIIKWSCGVLTLGLGFYQLRLPTILLGRLTYFFFYIFSPFGKGAGYPAPFLCCFSDLIVVTDAYNKCPSITAFNPSIRPLKYFRPLALSAI